MSNIGTVLEDRLKAYFTLIFRNESVTSFQ
jgi:hypothetical protein